MVPLLIALMNSSSCVGAPLTVACSTGSGYSCHIGEEAMESSLILRAGGPCLNLWHLVLPLLPRQ